MTHNFYDSVFPHRTIFVSIGFLDRTYDSETRFDFRRHRSCPFRLQEAAEHSFALEEEDGNHGGKCLSSHKSERIITECSIGSPAIQARYHHFGSSEFAHSVFGNNHAFFE